VRLLEFPNYDSRDHAEVVMINPDHVMAILPAPLVMELRPTLIVLVGGMTYTINQSVSAVEERLTY